MTDMRVYGAPVHRSLLQRDLLGGVPQAGLLILFVFAVVFVYGLSLYIMIVPVIIMYLVMRHLTGRDQYLIDIVLENIQQKDILIP
jgi:type IV secretory pathway TrbD component